MYEKISKLSIKLSGKCNCSCIYCHQDMFNKIHKNEFDDFDNLHKFILSLPLDDIVDVTVTGGETTTFIPLFERCCKELKKIEREREVRLDICVVHNCTNIDQIIKWCDRKIIVPYKTAISWDGIYNSSKSRFTKNFNDEYFLNELKKLGNSRYKDKIAITSAITPNTLSSLVDSFKFLIDNNLTNFGYYFIHEANYDGIEDLFKEQIEKVSEMIINSDKDIKFYNWQLLITRRLYPNRFYMCNKLGNNYSIDVDGKIYPCIYLGDHKSMCIGNLKDGIDYEKQKEFEDLYLRSPNCEYKKCKCYQCSECPASCFVHNHSFQNRFKNQCKLLEIENEVYDKYLSQLNTFESMKLISKNDVYINFDNENILDCKSCEIQDSGIFSPNYDRVRKWNE